jgi:hypothetical protein
VALKLRLVLLSKTPAAPIGDYQLAFSNKAAARLL